MLVIIRLCLLTFFLSNSAFAQGYSQVEQSWQGQGANTIINRLGNPQQIIRQRDGTIYYLYDFGNEYQTPRQFPGVGVNVGPDGRVAIVPPSASSLQPEINLKRCSITFVLNRQNQVISTQMMGSDCGDKVP